MSPEAAAEQQKSGEGFSGLFGRRFPLPSPTNHLDLPSTLDSSSQKSAISDCIYCPGDEYDPTYDPDGDGDMYTYDESEVVSDLGWWVTLDSDSRVGALTSIAQNEAQEAKNKGVLDEVIAAYHNRDADSIKALMGYSDSEMENLNSTAESYASSVYEDYPALQDEFSSQLALGGPALDKPGACSGGLQLAAASAGDVLENGLHLFVSPVSAETSATAAAGASCQWVQYVAALTVCAAAGPGYYWPCAYVAMCTFCSGDTVDLLCH